MPLNIITAAEGDWFHTLSPEMQKQYLEEHPNSKYAKEAKAAEPTIKSVGGPSPDKHPSVVHKGAAHKTALTEKTHKVVEKLPAPVKTFFHEKEYEPNSPVRKKLAAFAHNSVHRLVKSVIDEVGEWKGAASALRDLATGTKYSELDHHKKEALVQTGKFIATVAFTVGVGAAMEGGLEGLGELIKSGVGIALAREAVTHTLAKSGANAVIHAAYIEDLVLAAIILSSATDGTDEEDMKVLTNFVKHFADSIQHADIDPNTLVTALPEQETSMLRIVLADKWSKKVTENETNHTPPGLFKESAEKIASWLKKNSETPGKAKQRLSFYINRAGKNLTPEDKKRLDRAMDLIGD